MIQEKKYKLEGKKTDIVRIITLKDNQERKYLNDKKYYEEVKKTYNKQGVLIKEKTMKHSMYINGMSIYNYESNLFRKGYIEIN